MADRITLSILKQKHHLFVYLYTEKKMQETIVILAFILCFYEFPIRT